jgi:hypothetical protein
LFLFHSPVFGAILAGEFLLCRNYIFTQTLIPIQMKTNKLLYVISALGIIAMLMSCGTSNRVASSFGKRKYMKGYFFNNPSTSEAVAKYDNIVKPTVPAELNKPVQVATESTITQPVVIVSSTKHEKKQNAQSVKLAVKAIATVASNNTKQASTIKDNDESLAYAPTPGLENTQVDRGSYNTPALLGFAFSLLGILLYANGFAVVLLLLGVLFSAMGMKKTNHKIFAILGLILGILGLAIWFVYFILNSNIHPFNFF